MLPKIKSKINVPFAPGQFCVIRTYSAGVYLGYIQELAGTEAIVTDCQMLWQWSGAATLLQVANDGCESENLTPPVKKLYLSEVIAIIPITDKANSKLSKLKLWKI